MTATVTKTNGGHVARCEPCDLEVVKSLPSHADSWADGHNAARHLAEIEAEGEAER